MRFFTPELFLKFNSSDDEVANAADAEWEVAIQEYRRHLDGLRDQMADQVRRLAGIDLHDAELLAIEQTSEPFFLPPSFEPFPLWSGLAILSLKQGEKIVSLIYMLWDRMQKHSPEEAWPFSGLRTHWLYDEVDVAPLRPGLYLHRVLLSDGIVLEIPFSSVLVHSIPLQEDRRISAPMQSA